MQVLAAGAGEDGIMGKTDDTLRQADELLAGVRGKMALARETQGNMTRTMVRDWVRRIRLAADKLEDLA